MSQNTKGFTLIEVMIYIALFSLLMGSAFITAYQIIDGSQKLSVKTTTQDEGTFFTRKMSWILTGLDPAVSVSVGGTLPCDQTLRVEKINYADNPIIIRRNANKIEISQDNGAYVPITTENVSATCLKFRIIPALGSGPVGVTATSTINGVDFSITKYIRN